MKRRGYYNWDELYYSAIFGSGIYEWDGQYVQDPLSGNSAPSPLLVNIISGEQFYMKRLNCVGSVHSHYKARVLPPPAGGHIVWPCDMADLAERQMQQCGLFVAREYGPDEHPDEKQYGSSALLFPYGGLPKLSNGFRKLAGAGEMNWKNAGIRAMAAGMLRALESLNMSGYCYADFHLSRFYFDDSCNVILDFSNLVFSTEELCREGKNSLQAPEPGEYPIEFADPAVVRKLVPHFDYNSQNYSLCALLFYLLLGRYPYDGRLLTGYADDSMQAHYTKFRDYHKMPVFIFDPKDTQNAVGAFFEERQAIELWEELPVYLRDAFVQVLRRENAERIVPVDNPTPSMWLRLFETAGWVNQRERQVL